MPDLMDSICDDLVAEKASLAALLSGIDDAGWDTPTPAEPWLVRDQVSHLAYFDEKALLAHEDPDAFLAELQDADAVKIIDRQLAMGRGMSPAALMAWWGDANARLTSVYRTLEPQTRVVWYGPPMAARSKITARIMETWAHGQDVADGLGVLRAPSPRLRHVCHIGVRARGFAYVANGEIPPDDPVYVALTSPTGDVWEWGDPAAHDSVTGAALGFALLVTQRRHRDDVDVSAAGPSATHWLSIAQAFAGPPGEGRRPGQFADLERRP